MFAWIGWNLNSDFKDNDMKEHVAVEPAFNDRAGKLLEQGKEMEVVSLADIREKEFPKDPSTKKGSGVFS